MATSSTSPSAAPATPLLPTRELDHLIGEEQRLGATGRAIVSMARTCGAKHVATLHVTCSDEREKECADDFVKTVVRELSAGTFSRRAPMRTANMGSRYEWGMAALTAGHYNAMGTQDSLLIIKVSAHVGYVEHGGKRVYGQLERAYDTSDSCGALGFLLNGAMHPFAQELELLFHSDGKDRLGMLRDSSCIPAQNRSLLTSITSARLQAREAILDVCESNRRDPGAVARQVIVVCAMTINRPGADNELLVGFYSAVHDPSVPCGLRITWTGLPSDPSKLQVKHRTGSLVVSSDAPPTRWARGPKQHREIPLAQIRASQAAPVPQAAISAVDDAVESIQTELKAQKSPAAKLALTGAVAVMGEVMPVAGLALLFCTGAVDLHHAWRVHRVTSGHASTSEARAVFAELTSNWDSLSEAEAQLVVERLAAKLQES